jgi:hypothetical protein
VPIYTVPIPKKVTDYFVAHPFDADLDMVSLRAKDALARRGYVVGSGGVKVGPFGGELIIDADRDPTADLGVIDPAVKTDDETAAANLRRQVVDGLATLAADEVILRGPPAPNAAQVTASVLHMNSGMQKLVKVLRDSGLLNGDSKS